MLPPFHPEALEYVLLARSAIAYKSVPKVDEPSEEFFMRWIKSEGCAETIAPPKKRLTK